MKYIRTKDGELYLNLGETQNGVIVEYNYLGDGLDLAVNYDALEKQADTIEELCDEFIDTSELEPNHTSTGGWLYDEFDSKNKCLIYYVEDEKRTISLNEFDDLSKIYGAVWCEWGLKYVAKMNEEGELELI